MCLACSDHYPLRDPQLSQLDGRGHRAEGRGAGLPGGGGRAGGGKVKGQLSLRAVVTLVVKQSRKKTQCRVAAHCHWVSAPAPPPHTPSGQDKVSRN